MKAGFMKKCMSIWFLFLLAACSTPTSPALAPALEPTSTIIPTSTLTPSPTATFTPTPVPSGPCDNPLVPLATGNQWRYLSTAEEGESMFTLTSLERSDDRNIGVMVEFANQTRGDSVLERVVCLDGAIDNFPLFVIDMLLSDYLDKQFNTYHASGVYAPAYAEFAEKDWVMDWETEYLTEDRVRVRNPVGGSDLFVLESSPIRQSFQMDGTREDVTVPAGDFPGAIRVFYSFTLSVTITLPTGGTGGFLTLNSTQWYQPYVGLLRTRVDSASLNMGSEEFNVPYQSVVELVEFLPGP